MKKLASVDHETEMVNLFYIFRLLLTVAIYCFMQAQAAGRGTAGPGRGR